jgi:ArsR family transcriptional regulator
MGDMTQSMLNCISQDVQSDPHSNQGAVDRVATAAMLKALSDSKRLSIFDLLMEGVQCNCEIAERLGVSLSLVSYHLRILTEAGLVHSEPDLEDARYN